MDLCWAHAKEAVALVSRLLEATLLQLHLFSVCPLGVRDTTSLLYQPTPLLYGVLGPGIKLQCRWWDQLCKEISGSCKSWMELRGSFACSLTVASLPAVIRQWLLQGRPQPIPVTVFGLCSVQHLWHLSSSSFKPQTFGTSLFLFHLAVILYKAGHTERK